MPGSHYHADRADPAGILDEGSFYNSPAGVTMH